MRPHKIIDNAAVLPRAVKRLITIIITVIDVLFFDYSDETMGLILMKQKL